MSVTSTEDVANRLGRPLNPDEVIQVQNMLDDLELEIYRLAADRLTNEAWWPFVRSVCSAAVLRAARLPNSLDSVVPAVEGTGFSSDPQTQGAVYLRRSERRTLGIPNSGVAGINPTPSVPVHELGWPDPWWSGGDC